MAVAAATTTVARAIDVMIAGTTIGEMKGGMITDAMIGIGMRTVDVTGDGTTADLLAEGATVVDMDGMDLVMRLPLPHPRTARGSASLVGATRAQSRTCPVSRL